MRWKERCRIVMLMLFRRRRESVRLNDGCSFIWNSRSKKTSPVAYHWLRRVTPHCARSAILRFSASKPGRVGVGTWLETLLRNIRYGVRTLTRSPGFALTAILVMALGIGATTSLFTIVRAVLLKPLPFSEPGNLVMVYEHFRASTTGDGFNWVSPGDFRDWRQKTHGFQDMAAWRTYGFDLTGEQAELPEVVEAAAGSWNLFSLLGTPMALGRAFSAKEDQIGSDHVVLLTWSLFQRRFAGDPSILGKQIRLDTVPYQVIGVLPRWFNYPDAKVQLWVPYASTFMPAAFDGHDNHQSHVIARVKPGVRVEAATAEVGALQYQIHLANTNKPVAEEVRSRPMIDDVVQDAKTPLIVLLSAVSQSFIATLVLAFATLSLVLAAVGLYGVLSYLVSQRITEIGLRMALGAQRSEVLRLVLVDGLRPVLVGLLIGLAGGAAAAASIRSILYGTSPLDPIVLVTMVGSLLLTALLACAVPAIRASRIEPMQALRTE